MYGKNTVNPINLYNLYALYTNTTGELWLDLYFEKTLQMEDKLQSETGRKTKRLLSREDGLIILNFLRLWSLFKVMMFLHIHFSHTSDSSQIS